MRFDSWLIGLLVFSMLVVTGMLVMADLHDNYTEIDFSEDLSKFDERLNQTNEIDSTTSGMRCALFDTESCTTSSGLDSDNIEESLFKGGFSSISFITGSFSIFGNIVDAITEELGIPAYFKTIAMVAITILLIMAAIYLIFRFQPS